MPRKPTPSVLDTSLPPIPDEEAIVPEPIEEAAAPVVAEVVAEVQAGVDSVPAKPAKVAKKAKPAAVIAAAEPDQKKPAEAVVEEAVSPETTEEPALSPHHGMVDTMLLAWIGALALALDESPKLLHKLVERGEQARAKRMERMPHLRLDLRLRKSRAAEAEVEAEPEAPAEEPAAEPESEIPEEGEKDEGGGGVFKGPIITLNLLSFGSPVNIVPRHKPHPKA